MRLSHQLKSVMLFTFDHKTSVIKQFIFENNLFAVMDNLQKTIIFNYFIPYNPKPVHHSPYSS